MKNSKFNEEINVKFVVNPNVRLQAIFGKILTTHEQLAIELEKQFEDVVDLACEDLTRKLEDQFIVISNDLHDQLQKNIDEAFEDYQLEQQATLVEPFDDNEEEYS